MIIVLKETKKKKRFTKTKKILKNKCADNAILETKKVTKKKGRK